MWTLFLISIQVVVSTSTIKDIRVESRMINRSSAIITSTSSACHNPGIAGGAPDLIIRQRPHSVQENTERDDHHPLAGALDGEPIVGARAEMRGSGSKTTLPPFMRCSKLLARSQPVN